MKKTLKVGLALLVASSMASSAYAEEKETSGTGKVTGNAKAALLQTKAAGKPILRSFEGKGEIGYEMSKKVGSWTAKGNAAISIGADGTLEAGDRAVSLASDSLEIKMGYFGAGDPTKGPGYTGWVDESLAVGDNLTGSQGTFKVSATKVGVAFSIGSKINDKEEDTLGVKRKNQREVTYLDKDGKSSDYTLKAKDTTTGYKEDTYALHYGKKFGTVDLGLNYAMMKRVSDYRLGGKAKADKMDKNDGYKASDLGLGVAVSLGAMAVKFNYGSYNTKNATTTDSDDVETDEKMGQSTMALAFDMKLGDGGVSAYYGIKTAKMTIDIGSSSSEVKKETCAGGLAYQMKVGGVPLTFGYGTTKEKVTFGETKPNPTVTSKFGIDLKYAF
jgi:hypothetical protein